MSEQPAYDWGGPYLTAAFLCERVLEERDGVVSYIRVIDRLTFTPPGGAATDVTAPKPPVSYQLTCVVSFKSGKAKGRHDIAVQIENPTGLKGQRSVFPLLFEGEDRGVALNLTSGVLLEHEGLYWFDVLIDDRLVTRIPLRVVYQPVALGRSGTA